MLDDILQDVDGDWGDIQQKFLKAKEQEKLEEEYADPRRLQFPDFKDFYDSLKRIFISWDGGHTMNDPEAFHDFHKLIRSIFRSQNHDKFPTAFQNIWKIFCDPIRAKCETGIPCKQCHKRWDVLLEYDEDDNSRLSTRLWEDADHFGREMMVRRSEHRIRCPDCGYNLYHIVGGKILGIFEHEHIDEKEEYHMEIKRSPYGGRGNEIKPKFRNYFQE